MEFGALLRTILLPWSIFEEYKLTGAGQTFPKFANVFFIWDDSLQHSSLPVMLQLPGSGPEKSWDLPTITEQGHSRTGRHQRPLTSGPGLCSLP